MPASRRPARAIAVAAAAENRRRRLIALAANCTLAASLLALLAVLAL
jgi:hypothetical protein